ncbi:MAG: DUF1838 domain-containing protein [Pyrinomonadaceae bacterium]|nr:DUF1838 domain-containing protein [Pyrinomonadaceae bacterium]
MKKLIFLVTIISLFATYGFSQKKTKRTVQQLNVEANFARPDGKDMVFYIKGSAYSFIPGERPQKIFGVDGYNIRKRVETPEKDGFFLSTREIVFYTDPKTDEIIDEWTNPWTKEKCEVFHIQNDPVNGRFRVRDGKYISVSMDGKNERGEPGAPQEINNHLVWTSDVFPFYPLPGFDKNYTASEMFDFYVEKDELNKTTPPKNVMISWTRVGPWLPWMKMPNNGGVIIVHARSWRMEKWDLLPERIKNLVKTKYPTYMTAPDKVDPAKPNETSWTFYNRVMAERQKK